MEPPKDKQWNNARRETAHKLGSFRTTLEHHRSVFPVSRFAEREGIPYKKTKIWFGALDDSIVSIAGIMSRWRSLEGSVVNTATMVTSEPNAWLRPFHKRPLMFLEDDEVSAWLDNGSYDHEFLQELMVPPSEEFLKIVDRSRPAA